MAVGEVECLLLIGIVLKEVVGELKKCAFGLNNLLLTIFF